MINTFFSKKIWEKCQNYWFWFFFNEILRIKNWRNIWLKINSYPKNRCYCSDLIANPQPYCLMITRIICRLFGLSLNSIHIRRTIRPLYNVSALIFRSSQIGDFIDVTLDESGQRFVCLQCKQPGQIRRVQGASDLIPMVEMGYLWKQTCQYFIDGITKFT